MSDYEGSRTEFLTLLAEFGEEPAFVRRAMQVEFEWRALTQYIADERLDMLRWTKLHLATLADRVRRDWGRLGKFLTRPEDADLLESLYASLAPDEKILRNWLLTERRALRNFLDSAKRFNREYSDFLDQLDLTTINRVRRDYNDYYPLEKACAFGFEAVDTQFKPLAMIGRDDLLADFPLLVLPKDRITRWLSLN